MFDEQQKFSLQQTMGQSPSAQVEASISNNRIKDEEDRVGSSNDIDNQNQKDKDEKEDEEEELECGFCLFMKGGGCKDEFIAWEKCVEEAEKNKEDIVEACFKITDLMKKCMDAHADYYEPILRAEKAMEEEAGRALDQEVKRDAPSATSHDSDEKVAHGASTS